MKKPTKILFIAYSFPPISGAGVFRSFRFSRDLPELGYKPYILTIADKAIKARNLKTDPLLLEQLPEQLKIIRTPAWDLMGIKRSLMKLRIYRLFWFFCYPLVWEPGALWPFSAYKTALKTIRDENIQLIYTSSSPFSSMLLGYMLKRKTGVKWVADLRDPYTDAYNAQWPSKFHWYLSRMVEKWLIRRTDRLIVNTPEVKSRYLQRKLIEPEKIHVLTNGF